MFLARNLLVLCLATGLLLAQQPVSKMSEAEEQSLKDSIRDAGQNPTELMRALERHLEKYPNTPERADLELALAKSAIEMRDNRRIILYGERVLTRSMDDPQILERVTRALLVSDDKESAAKALKYSQKLEELLYQYKKNPPKQADGRFQEEYDRALGRAFVFQARATGNLGRPAEAAKLAQKSYDVYPTAEAARETGKWLAAEGKNEDALRRYADAFIIADARNTDADRTKDRLKLSEIYHRSHETDAGLGEYILQAYDRTSTALADRKLRLKQVDPNAQVTDPMDYTVTGLSGDKLDLKSLRGKVVIMDFWATWCGPCRAQHPLFEQVKARFKDRQDVIFLAIDTDEDHSLVEPFLKRQGWTGKVYFEQGLSELLQVSSIPTTVIFDQKGALVSRMAGFIPERFADQLTDRISELLQHPPQ